MLEDMRSRLVGSKLKPLYASETQAVGLYGPALVTIARTEPDEPIVREAPRWVDQLLSTHPERGIYIVVVQASARAPSEEARKRIDHTYSAFGRGVVAGAMVIEGVGFMAASIRSALSLLMLKSRYEYPLKTFATPTEGAAFLCPKLPRDYAMTVPQLVSGVEDLRAAYEAEVGVFTAGSVRS
jgi:hypothetical protein